MLRDSVLTMVETEFFLHLWGFIVFLNTSYIFLGWRITWQLHANTGGISVISGKAWNSTFLAPFLPGVTGPPILPEGVSIQGMGCYLLYEDSQGSRTPGTNFPGDSSMLIMVLYGSRENTKLFTCDVALTQGVSWGGQTVVPELKSVRTCHPVDVCTKGQGSVSPALPIPESGKEHPWYFC